MRKFTAFFLALFAWASIASATVSDSISRVQYSCNGSLTDFDFTFGVTETTDIAVVLTDSDDTESTLTETSDYSISCTNDDCTSGGTVTTVDTYASGNTLTILRAIDLTQESDFVENQPALYDTFETALDKLTYIAQQQQEEISRSLKYNKTLGDSPGDEISGSASDLPNMFLGFDEGGAFTLKEAPALSVNEDAAFSVNTLSVLEAYTGDSTTLFVEGRTVAGDGYQGYFQYVLGDYSSECAADATYKGVFVPKSGVATTTGCWIRRDYLDHLRVVVANWFATNSSPGTTDMTLGIQAAVDLLTDLGYGGTLKLLAETYLTDGIVLPANTIVVNIKGAGQRYTTILMGTPAGPVIRKETDSPDWVIMGGKYSGFTIKANASSNIANTSHIGIDVVGCWQCLFEDIGYQSNGSGNLYALFHVATIPYLSYHNTFRRIRCTLQTGPAKLFWFDAKGTPLAGSNQSTIEDFAIFANTGMTTAIDALESGLLTITHGAIEGNTGAIAIALGSFTTVDTVWFENNLPNNDLVIQHGAIYDTANCTIRNVVGLNPVTVPSGIIGMRFISAGGSPVTGAGSWVQDDDNAALSLTTNVGGIGTTPVFGGSLGTTLPYANPALSLFNTDAAATGNQVPLNFWLKNDHDADYGITAEIRAVDEDKTNRDTSLIFSTCQGTSGMADALKIDPDGNLLFLMTHTPSSASDTCTAGQYAWDANYIYQCVATDTWKRGAISTW